MKKLIFTQFWEIKVECMLTNFSLEILLLMHYKWNSTAKNIPLLTGSLNESLKRTENEQYCLLFALSTSSTKFLKTKLFEKQKIKQQYARYIICIKMTRPQLISEAYRSYHRRQRHSVIGLIISFSIITIIVVVKPELYRFLFFKKCS